MDEENDEADSGMEEDNEDDENPKGTNITLNVNITNPTNQQQINQQFTQQLNPNNPLINNNFNPTHQSSSQQQEETSINEEALMDMFLSSGNQRAAIEI